jgi:hypothetical protein
MARVREAAGILQESSAVVKPTRSGFTTSAVLAARGLGKRICVVTPTRRIGNETVLNANPQAVCIPGNNQCLQLKAQIKEDPLLAELPLPLPDCKKCKAAKACEVLEILRADPKGIEPFYLTYAKIEALMLSSSETAKEIKRRIGTSKIVLFDEAHHLAFPEVPKVMAFREVELPPGFRSLARVMSLWRILCQDNAALISELQLRGNAGHVGQHLAKFVFINKPLSWRAISGAFKQLLVLALKRDELGIKKAEILALRDIITILSSPLGYASYVKERDEDTGQVYLFANYGKTVMVLREFMQMMSYAKPIFCSGTLIEPRPGYFKELSGQEVRPAIFQEGCRLDSKMLIIPDTWRLGVKGFKYKLPTIIERIREILAEEGQAYIIAPNGRMAGIIEGELQKAGIEAQVDYYRSVNTIGVAQPERVCIAIGTAQVPSNAYDYLAHGKDHDERLIESQRLRRQSVHCATWQAWSRVKDPEGKAESRVYCIGVPLKEVKEISLWGTGRRLELKEIREQKTPDGSVRIPVFEVKVDKELCCARIQAANKHRTRSDRRTVGDYIAKIRYFNEEDFINENIKISDFRYILPNYITRGNVAKLGIYNFPKDNFELDSTAGLLYALFANRTDAYALQVKDSISGKWQFVKVPKDWDGDLELIKDHIKGKITIGVYEISLNDYVIWLCFDIDDHEGTKDARAECEKLLAVLRSYGIPFLLEASGSPGSYHIWILLEPTKTLNAFVFARQIASEAGVSCEIWPKQKELTKNSKYGNLVKLPVCYHHKSASRSVFLNPDFEPIEGPIIPPGLVRLLEVPDYSKPPAGMRGQGDGGQGRRSSSKTLDYCMERALADSLPLNHSEGHNLRLAIAVKAQVIGMTAEATAQLFQHQEDYDFEFSLNKVRETWTYDYSPWSCPALKDKCGSIVSRYCSSCPFGGGRILQKSKEVPA